MSSNGLLMLVILGLSILVLAVLVFIITKVKSGSDRNAHQERTVHHYVKIVANKKSSYEEIEKAIEDVICYYPFPYKPDYKMPVEAKPYLDFVFFVVYNKNSTPKLIAYMDKELKKVNPDYKNEIDAYEEEGIKKRKFNK